MNNAFKTQKVLEILERQAMPEGISVVDRPEPDNPAKHVPWVVIGDDEGKIAIRLEVDEIDLRLPDKSKVEVADDHPGVHSVGPGKVSFRIRKVSEDGSVSYVDCTITEEGLTRLCDKMWGPS